jgi:hypothetical protein
MRQGSTLSPADKIRRVAKTYGIPGLLSQQPTTVAIRDTLDLSVLSTTGYSTLNFFDGVNSRSFPDTNLQSNTFSAGQCLLIQQISFSVVTKSSGVITAIDPIENSTLPNILGGDFSLLITGQQVMNQVALLLGYAPFNPDANFMTASADVVSSAQTVVKYGHAVIGSDVDLAIVPNRQFVLPVRIPAVSSAPSAGTKYLRVDLSGYGTVPALQGTT